MVEIWPRWERQIDLITDEEVIEFVDLVAARGALVSSGRYIAYLQAFLNWAKSRRIIKINSAVDVAAGVRPPSATRPATC